MLRTTLASSKYIVVVAILGIYVAAVALILYEIAVVGSAIVDTLRIGSVSPEGARLLAVGLLAAIDVFLIAIVGYITCVGLFALFIDDTIPLPAWLVIRNIEDLKNNLISVVVAVLAVLFLKEAVARTRDLDLLGLGIAVALMIASLTFFLKINATAPRAGDPPSEKDGS
ncbi:MAG: YqhA family protein [Hyphomicrobium zavarzinii]|uniref:YqhA family protein n=1 Tax=Hyphomicrobium zavarzinii TaxID=48292 RepID=UPI001A57197B|nr:YqhA family protein [Hyphomicrobium zavarzinii]MBL8847437.1 YqhA family protein [Hyphomicrobium zavarzinii]